MQNSFSLGLLHGALFGFTPLTPWFIGLKHYVCEGQTKGLLTFAGLFLGQVTLLLAALVGGKELLWVWYYLQPLLAVCGLLIMVRMIIMCWKQYSITSPVLTRREGANYVGAGMLFALCNPSGTMLANLLMQTLPANVFLYLCGFLPIYACLSAGFVYIVCLSPLGQKFFGQWSISRMQQGLELDLTYFPQRILWVRRAALVTAALVIIQFVPVSDTLFWASYPDSVLRPIPGVKPLKPDLKWLEAEVKELSNSADPLSKKITVSKLQSPAEGNDTFDKDFEFKADETDWGLLYRYHGMNEALEREELDEDIQENEIKYFQGSGPDVWLLRLYNNTNLRLVFNPFSPWEKTHTTVDSRIAYEAKLKKIRATMDNLRNHNTPLPEVWNGIMYDERASFMPFHLEFETDYELDPVSVGTDHDVTPEDVDTLIALANDEELLLQTEFFIEGYDHSHRGEGDEDNLTLIQLQNLPQEVHFPWDYPALPPANCIRHVSQVCPPSKSKSKKAGVAAMERENAVHNQSIEFLDPIALNTRFLANNPLPITDALWSNSKKAFGLPEHTMEPKSTDIVRQLWYADPHADPDENNLKQREMKRKQKESDLSVMQTPRDIMMAKVIPSRTKH